MENKKLEIGNFLGVTLPEQIALPHNCKIRFLERTDIENILLERSPFYFIDKAISFRNDNNNEDLILSVATITEAKCEGHFPLRLIAPYIEFFKLAAQSGVLLAGLTTPNHVPIANGDGRFSSFVKHFIYPPVKVLIESRIEKWYEYGTKLSGENTTYVDEKMVARLWTDYILISKPVFLRINRAKKTEPSSV